MKKLLILATLMWLSMASIFGQKVDIDKHRFYIQTPIYPAYDIAPDERTYTLEAIGDDRYTDQIDDMKISGFEKVEGDGNFNLVMNVSPLRKGMSNVKTRKVQKKDKDGNVISTTKYYTGVVENSSSSNLRIYSPKKYEKFTYMTPTQKEKAVRKKKEREEYEKKKARKKAAKEPKKKNIKRKKKKSKKEKEEAENPFLKGVDTTVDEVEDTTAEPVDDLPNENLMMTLPVGWNNSHNTSESRSYKTANSEVNRKKDDWYINDESAYRRYLVSYPATQVAKLFNYRKGKTYVSFRKLDSKKHPEYETYRNATEGFKVILGKLRYNQPKDEVHNDLKPIISYLDELGTRLSPKEKHSKKLRAACWYNIAELYYHLDMPEKTIEYAEKLIADGYRDGDGKDFLEKADELQARLAFFNQDWRYNNAMQAQDQDDDSIEAESTEDTGSGN